MLGSYRGIFAALAGLALSGAQPPHQDTQRTQSANQPEPATLSPKFAAYPDYNPDPCYHTEDHDAADLCAQWRAAVAAEKATHEARRATTWSIVATILSAVGLGAIFIGLQQTRQTLLSGHAAERPYVYFFRTKKEIKRRAVTRTEYITAVQGVTFRNVGKSQAYVRALKVETRRQGEPPLPSDIPLEKYPPSHAIIPEEEWPLKHYMPVTFLPDWLNDTGGEKVFVVGRMLYSDAFGKHYLLHFCRVFTGNSFTFWQHRFPELESDSYNGSRVLDKKTFDKMLDEAGPRT